MARGEVFNSKIENIAAGGAGIASFEGKKVFVELSAPGDTVKCRITKEKKSWAEAELLEILEASPLRKEAECRFYGLCGGCSLQHLDYSAQIKAKTAILRSAFQRIGGIDPKAIRAHRSSPYEYRNRLRFHTITSADDQGKIKLGFKERKSPRLVAVDDCPVADAGIRKALKEKRFSPRKDSESFSVYSKGSTLLFEGGEEKGRVSILDRELAMDVKLFFQSNAEMLELLIKDLKTAAEGANRNLPLADIYCGVGTFASFLCGGSGGMAGFSEADLIEENKSALALAGENMPQGLKANCHALSDSAWVKSLDKKNKKSWGLMVLDPPRGGLSGPLSGWLAKSGPCLVAYVSCDPATLARDSGILAEGGYTLKELNLYDFYPQTAHIESLAVFSREAS